MYLSLWIPDELAQPTVYIQRHRLHRAPLSQDDSAMSEPSVLSPRPAPQKKYGAMLASEWTTTRAQLEILGGPHVALLALPDACPQRYVRKRGAQGSSRRQRLEDRYTEHCRPGLTTRPQQDKSCSDPRVVQGASVGVVESSRAHNLVCKLLNASSIRRRTVRTANAIGHQT
jgi:hypothetical protein